MRGSAIAIAALAMLAGCKRSTPPPSEAPAVNAAIATAVDAGPAPRCKAAGDLATKSGGWLVGDAVATDRATLVGTVRAQDPEAYVEAIGGATWTIAKGPEMIADAPPPKPLAAPGDPLAAVLLKPGLVLVRLGAGGAVTRLATFPVRSTESLAFDAAVAEDGKSALLAWDDDAIDGGITLAIARVDGAPGAKPRVVSSPKSDVDAPRVAPKKGGGFWVAWIERKALDERDRDASEAPAEDRAQSWIDLAAIDPDAAPRRITSATGHASSFDLAPRASGELDVIARDETQEREGSGGRILHVVARDGAIDEPSVLVASGVGRGSVDAIGDWLAFDGVGDHAMIAPLTPSRALAGPPTAEPALDDARVLDFRAPDRVIAVAEGEATAFRDVRCGR